MEICRSAFSGTPLIASMVMPVMVPTLVILCGLEGATWLLMTEVRA